MELQDALAGRRSVRAYLDQPVDLAVVQSALERAARAPSGGNVQPWHVAVVAGATRDRIVARVGERLATGGSMPEPEYPVYPPSLWSPYRERRFANGEQLYAALGIPREDKLARLGQFARNWEFFGAPVGAFVLVDRGMGAAQWSDLGGFLQSFLLLLHEQGLGSCAQEAWAAHHDIVTEELGAAERLMLFCGVAIGHPDVQAPVNQWTSERAPASEWVTIHHT